MRELEFYVCNGGKYPYVPHREELGKTRFITTPSKYYDDLRGQQIIEDYIEDTVFAERLGYDGAIVIEQHGGPNSLVGQSITIAATLIARTSRMRIGTVGALLNSYLSPIRFAEEIATLDILSRGRYFGGLPMGIGGNYHSLGVMNPTYARERFREAHDMVMAAFKADEPFKWDGKFFQSEYVNLWPKPIQKPCPEMWVPASGSKDSLTFAANNGYTYVAVLVPWPILLKNCQNFKQSVIDAGQEFDPRRIAATAYVHVAETDKQARREAEGHLMSVFQNSLGSPFHDSFPPGHVTPQSLRGMAAGGGYRSVDLATLRFEDGLESGQFIVGSSDTVAERIEEITTQMDAGRLFMFTDSWTMPSWMTRKNMTLFAEEVMPRFRKRDGKPLWDKDETGYAANTRSEYGARVGEAPAVATADIQEVGRVDITTSHIPELCKPIK
ncbi:LLM class flavin-dependent oxidoreductase [Psychromarinibacter sp. C21-152]|uniref:LLM class flavin-dependent oxidoreductase n=1 Tax=Psychromarinibacter sediminicola TaxID=3033385 RepID=A0AAE3NRZ0_9RHOB|nr:LLM class flavin-dependent oxidoreductase [Psychromarinibacter sediminicola]MDF0600987.1 LLM class flavin-dependent oxidoreductase [Psychromarinibacter sediminicola]